MKGHSLVRKSLARDTWKLDFSSTPTINIVTIVIVIFACFNWLTTYDNTELRYMYSLFNFLNLFAFWESFIIRDNYLDFEYYGTSGYEVGNLYKSLLFIRNILYNQGHGQHRVSEIEIFFTPKMLHICVLNLDFKQNNV